MTETFPSKHLIEINEQSVSELIASVPNVYYEMDEGVADTSATSVADKTSTLGDMTTGTSNTVQWTTEPSYWDGVRATPEYMQLLRGTGAGATAWDTVFNIGQGTFLIGFEAIIATPGNVQRFLMAGSRNSVSSENRGLQFRSFPTTRRINLYITDDDNVETSETGVNLSSANYDAGMIQFFYIDNRPTQKTFDQYVYIPGTNIVEVGTQKALPGTNISCIETGAEDDASLTVGAEYSYNSGILGNAFDDSIRRLRAFNFGQNPPANLSGIMDALAISRLTNTHILGTF